MSSPYLIGLSHRRAPVELRERVSLSEADAAELSRRLAGDGGEAVCLSTCNRTEIYGAGDDAEALALLSESSGLSPDELAAVMYRLRDDDVALHLYRVAAGLDSLVPGEGQILGQVRSAFDQGVTGPLLDRMFRGAIHAGRKVRAQTAIGEVPASVAAAAAALAEQLFGDLTSCSVMLLGAGKTGELAAASLVARGARIELVANRSPTKAQEVAERYGGTAVALAEAADRLPEADVVVASTSARGFVLDRAAVEPTLRARKGRPLFFIDIAVPRDVDPAVHELEGCYVYDIDDLEAVVTDSTPGRAGEVCAGGGDRRRRGAAVRRLARCAGGRAHHRVASRRGRGDPRAGARARPRPPGEADGCGARRRGLDHRADRRQAASRADPEAQGSGRRPTGRRCWFASAPAAVGSRSPRPVWQPTCCARTGDIEIALVPITTTGDRDRRQPFGEIGERGVFVKELEEALLDGRIDVAVHSAKDMTSTDTAGLVVGAYPPREDARDALVGSDRLAPGMRVGTASARRRAQLLALEPSLSIEPLRGNIDTRLRKRSERGLDAIVLAACGLDRLGLEAEVGHRFEPADVLPEAGQGALALQVREGEEEIVAAVDDAETRRRVVAERACVAEVGGGCLAPVAAYHDGDVLEALVADEDGRWIERRRHDDPVALARELVELAAAR